MLIIIQNQLRMKDRKKKKERGDCQYLLCTNTFLSVPGSDW